jgi:hypothetical protein
MTAMLSGVIYLLESVILSHLPSSPVSFLGENLDHVGRATVASVASLPLLRRHLGSSAGDGRLLSLESFRFYACLHSALSASSGLHWSSAGGCFAAPLFSGGYFAAVMLWWILCHCRHIGWSSLQADALPSWLVGRVDVLPSWLGLWGRLELASSGCFAVMVAGF